MILDYRDFITLAAVALVLAWDIFLARKGEGNTLSFRWARWAQKWPIWPLLVGILLGHLFFPNRAFCP